MIFSALASTLNQIFDLVLSNLTGFDCSDCKGGAAAGTGMKYKRGVVDEFFFTAVYTIIIYMMATSSFKMIDQIPGNMMRWFGSRAAPIMGSGNMEGDMMRYVAYGGRNMADQAINAMETTAKLGGNVMGSPFRLLSNRAKGNVTAAGRNSGEG
jgi:hypothetical protein